ncbi:hypothetical protein CLCAR_1728 [Clostridium carboxidivorans P7]|nr:hypothetical protein CLCAR_1728 [Clostridium carboxidivorans P7]
MFMMTIKNIKGVLLMKVTNVEELMKKIAGSAKCSKKI